MKKYSLIFSLLFIISVSFCFAQDAEIKEDFQPSTLNQPGQEYPQVNSQGYARFKINAPEAQNVHVSLGLGGRGGTKLTKEEEKALTLF